MNEMPDSSSEEVPPASALSNQAPAKIAAEPTASLQAAGPLGIHMLFQRPLVSGFLATIGVLGALVLGGAFSVISFIVMYIVLALFLAICLDPLVRTLERRHVKRGAGLAIVFGGFVVVFAAFLIWVLPAVLAQIGDLVRAIPAVIKGVPQADWFVRLPADTQATIMAAMDSLTAWLTSPSTLAALSGGLLAAGVSFAAGLSASFIIVALTLYFLASLDSMKVALCALAPARNRPQLADMTDRITGSVGSALLGSITLSALNAGATLLLHLVIGLPFPALMAVVAFIITLIPLFGSVIFWVLATILALFTGTTQAAIFAVAYFIYMQIEAYVLSPRIMNKAISIPPSLVLIAALVGGTLGGVMGVLLALPVAASILMVIREVVVPKQDLKVG